jgi:uncharacterized membrane protein (UPF0127 family)
LSGKKKPSIKSKSNLTSSFIRNRRFLHATLLILLLIIAYFVFFHRSANEPQWVKEGEVIFINAATREVISRIDVEVASTHAERMKGLMYRSSMDYDKGMLFLFEKEEVQSFWMKNTILPLDIIFIDSRGVINTIYTNTTPYSEKSLPSKKPSRYVVEVNGGYCKNHGIKEGDLIEYKIDVK